MSDYVLGVAFLGYMAFVYIAGGIAKLLLKLERR